MSAQTLISEQTWRCNAYFWWNLKFQNNPSYLIDIYYLNLWNCPKILKIKSLYRARNQKFDYFSLIFQGGGIELGLYQHLSMRIVVLKLTELCFNIFIIKIKSCLREYIGIRQRYGSKSEYFWENLKSKNYPFFFFFFLSIKSIRIVSENVYMELFICISKYYKINKTYWENKSNFVKFKVFFRGKDTILLILSNKKMYKDNKLSVLR